MNREKAQVLRHLKQVSKKVKFLDSDFKKAQPLSGENGPKDPPSGNWGGVPICVEVARKDGQVAVRDSKDKQKGYLVFSNEEWKAFLIGVKAGQFDVK